MVELNKKKRRRLKGVKIEEVSWVDMAANKREFMFVKRDPATVALDKKAVDLKVEFTTKGTPDTTVLKINGKSVADPKNLALYFSPMGPDNVSLACEYTVKAKNETNGGFNSTRTYRMVKNVDGSPAEDNPADPADLETIQVVCPDLEDADAIVAKALAPMTQSIALYKDDLPADVLKDIGRIIKLAIVTEAADTSEGEIAMSKAEEGDTTPDLEAQMTALVESQKNTNEAIDKLTEAIKDSKVAPEPPAAPVVPPAAPAAPAEGDEEVDITDEQIAAEAMEEALAEAGAAEE